MKNQTEQIELIFLRMTNQFYNYEIQDQWCKIKKKTDKLLESNNGQYSDQLLLTILFKK